MIKFLRVPSNISYTAWKSRLFLSLPGFLILPPNPQQVTDVFVRTTTSLIKEVTTGQPRSQTPSKTSGKHSEESLSSWLHRGHFQPLQQDFWGAMAALEAEAGCCHVTCEQAVLTSHIPSTTLKPSPAPWPGQDLEYDWLVQPANTFFKQRWTEMTIFQPARSMNQNLMEEPNLSLGSVNAECLQNWTVRGSTEKSHSVLELCLPSSEMQRVGRAHTRRIASPLCPTDSEGPRRSWWEMLSSEMHSFLQCVTAKSGSLCDTVEKKKPLYSICLSEGWIAWERRICLERLGWKGSDKQVWAPYLAHSNYFPSDKQTISSFLISSRSGFAV